MAKDTVHAPPRSKGDRWEAMNLLVEAYLRRYHVFPKSDTVVDNVPLGKWLDEQRWRASLGVLGAEQTQRLGALDAIYAQLNPSALSVLLSAAAKEDAIRTAQRERPARRKAVKKMTTFTFRTTDSTKTSVASVTAKAKAVTDFYNAEGKLPGKNNRDLKAEGQVLDYWLYDVRSALKAGTLSQDAIALLSAEPWWKLIEARAFGGKKAATPTPPAAPSKDTKDTKDTDDKGDAPRDPASVSAGDLIVSGNGGVSGIAIGEGKMITDVGDIVDLPQESAEVYAPAATQEDVPAESAEEQAPSEDATDEGADAQESAVQDEEGEGDAAAPTPAVPARRADGRFRPHTRSKLADKYRQEYHGEVVPATPAHIQGVDVYRVSVNSVVPLAEIKSTLVRHHSNGGTVVELQGRGSAAEGKETALVTAAYLVTDLESALRAARAYGYTVSFSKVGI